MSFWINIVADLAMIKIVLFFKMVRLCCADFLVMPPPVFGDTDAVAFQALSRISTDTEGRLLLYN
jgi:hypothetical protein